MFGVVLWSDKREQNVVIWCEDHGDLAFYSGCDESGFDGLALDAGDFIEFELAEEQNLRVARDVQMVAQSQYLGLAETLKINRQTLRSKARSTSQATGNVIEFSPQDKRARLAS